MAQAEGTFPLPQRRRIAGVGLGGMRSVRRGAGSDVAGSRPYLPGDDLRTIDRHASARLSAALDRDEWIVRQTYADESARVVLVADRRPSMSLFPDGLPWLRKPAALAAVGELVVRSAETESCVAGYLELAADGEPVWLAPGRAREEQLVEAAAAREFRAPRDALDQALSYLAVQARLPTGSFVFVVSDFLAGPSDDALGEALARRWQLVPVVVQDPRWERSFPDAAGVVLPVADPETGRVRPVRPTRREAAELRARHERRWAAILGRFEAFGIEPVVLDSHEPAVVLDALREWADQAALAGARL
ncbi:MAG TPA: DUF58 domain-containing protein [Gaiellaceae bacterium]|nr:DUF58 domain-containing protein [Gaiellaceae bacterium]